MRATTTTLELGDGTTEIVEFVGDVFCVTHLPEGRATARVVICSPVYSEFLKNNRREVLLARRLAAGGLAVQRFHYRGTGNSGGDPAGLSLTSMTEDAKLAAARLSEAAGEGPIDVVSTRLASLVSTSITGSDSRIVMWEPVHQGKQYFRELTRALLILGVKHGEGRTAQDLEAEFTERGRLDIAGFAVARSLRDSVVSQALEIPTGTGAVRVVQLGRTTEARKDIVALATSAEKAGRDATTTVLELEEAWWFHLDVNLLAAEDSTLDDSLVDLTADWLTGDRS